MTRVCIVGAGAAGGYLGAHLTAGGVDTTLVDAWPEHVEAMRANGLSVSGMDGAGSVETPVRALHICDVPQLAREQPFDVAFIAVKSYDTKWATQLVLPYMLARGGSGQLVMISSVAGKAGVPLRTAYCAAKHGLVGYSDALRAE